MMSRCDIEELQMKISVLEEKLQIAIGALEYIKKLPIHVCCDNEASIALDKIAKIKE